MRTKTPAGVRILGGVLFALFVCWGAWVVLNVSPLGFNFTIIPKPKTPVDAINAANCGSRAPGSTRRCDPVDPTFYDDPTLRFSIKNPITDWDRLRKQWLKHHPSYAAGLDDRILFVTGSQPSECTHKIGDHLNLRFFKNKVDYCRRHGYEIFYNIAVLNPSMTGCWAKIQTIRSAMLAHPESEWIFWIDSDAAFTDMDFKVPLQRYKDHNLVVHGWEDLIYEKKSWVSVNAGVFLIRNCQWAIDFLNEWAEMGPQTARYEEWGRIQTATFKDKPFPAADDQSGIVYMLLKGERRWREKTYVENEYSLHGYWISMIGRFENITRRYEDAEMRWRSLRRRHAEVVSEHYGELWGPRLEGAGYESDGWRRPFVTHFTGCQPCSGNHNPDYEGKKCWDGMRIALNFADNQVIRNYGFVHKSLLDYAVEPVSTRFYDNDDEQQRF